MPRPHLSDVLLRIVEGLGGEILAINIYQVSQTERHFGARAVITNNAQELNIDMRASDAISLSLLEGVLKFSFVVLRGV
jgi:bifunctional DNase/RNase